MSFGQSTTLSSSTEPTPRNQCTAATIPASWLHRIYSFLSFREMHSSSLTCKRWFGEAVQQPLRNVELRLAISRCVSNFDSGSPLLRHIVTLTMNNKHQPLTLPVLVSLTHLPNLRRLEGIFEIGSTGAAPSDDEEAQAAEISNKLQEIKSGAFAKLESCTLDITVTMYDVDIVHAVIPALVRMMPNLVEVDFQCRGAHLNDNDDFVSYNYQDLLPLTHLRKLVVHQDNNRRGAMRDILLMATWRAIRQLPLTEIKQGMAWSKRDLENLLAEPHNLEKLHTIDLEHTSFETVDHVELLEPVWQTLTSFKPLGIPMDALPLLQNFTSLTSLALCLTADAVELVECPEGLAELLSGGHLRLLKSLQLCVFMFQELDVQHIIDGCPLLEDLRFIDCGFTGFPDLQNAVQLRTLQFHDELMLEEDSAWIDLVDLDTFVGNISHCPNLNKLELSDALGQSLSEDQRELLEKELKIQIEVDYGY